MEALTELETLRARLEEAEETLRAIRSGEVDALVVEGPKGEQVFTLQGAEHAYRILVETMTEGAMTLRDNGVIYYCNAHLGAMLKMPLEKIMGLRLQQFIMPAQAAAFKALLDNTGPDRRGEFQFVASDGKPLPVLVSLSALPEAAAGDVCAVVTDLSCQKHAETLEKLVSERTTQLREKIGQLEAFSYTISHDMRQPLRAMQGYANALLDGHGAAFEPEPRQLLERIQKAANRLDRLIQDVLTYSQATRCESELIQINLGEIVTEVVESYPNLRNAKFDIACCMPSVRGYEVALTQSIANLLANAVKFVPAGKIPEIKIWSEPRDGLVRLWIQDNGIGIAGKDQKKIFEIFSRLNGNEVYEGTGIGLSIVAKAIGQMGGKVGVDSELGQGSRFWIELQKADPA